MEILVSPKRPLSDQQRKLLEAVLSNHRDDAEDLLHAAIRGELTPEQVELVVSEIAFEVSAQCGHDGEPNQRGLLLEELLDTVNAQRFP